MDNQLKEKIEELNIKHQKEVKATILSHNIFLETGVKPTVYTHYEREAIGIDFNNKFHIGEKNTLKKVFTYLLKHFPLDEKGIKYKFSFAAKESIKLDGSWSIDIDYYNTKLRYESKELIIFCSLPTEEMNSCKQVSYNNHKKEPDIFIQNFLKPDLLKYVDGKKTTIYSTGDTYSKRYCYAGTNEQLIQMMTDYANS